MTDSNTYKLILIGGLHLLIPVLLPPFGPEGGGGVADLNMIKKNFWKNFANRIEEL